MLFLLIAPIMYFEWLLKYQIKCFDERLSETDLDSDRLLTQVSKLYITQIYLYFLLSIYLLCFYYLYFFAKYRK